MLYKVLSMKKTLIPILIVLLFSCCTHHQLPQVLNYIDSLCNANPERAVFLLKEQKGFIETQPEYIRKVFQLLTIKADDKNYVVHQSDSSILDVIHYFEKHNQKYLPEAYYYGGRVYHDMGDAPQALDYYQKSANILESSHNYDLLKRVYSQMGNLFLYQNVYEEAMKSLKKAYDYNMILKDTNGIVRNLVDISDIYKAFHKKDSALYYGEKALNIANICHSEKLKNIAYITLADIDYQLGNYEEALVLTDSILAFNIIQQKAAISIRGDTYFKLDQLDSANYYYNKLLSFGDISSQRGAYRGMMEIAHKKGEADEIISYTHLYDSISKIYVDQTNAESIRKMQSLYNYQLKEKENATLKETNANQHTQLLVFAFTIIILCLFSILLLERNKKRKIKMQQKTKEIKELKERIYKQSELYKKEKNIQIKKLENEIKKITDQNNSLRKKYELELEKVTTSVQQQQLYLRQKEIQDKEIQNTAIYIKFHEAAERGNKIQESDWAELQKRINNFYPDFFSALRLLHPFKQHEIRVSMLVKINLRVSDIAIIMNKSRQSITSTRERCYIKALGEKGSSSEWDEYIRSL